MCVEGYSVRKKTLPNRDGDYVPQDWSSLVPGQLVCVRPISGHEYTAVIETKTSDSSVVWIIRNDWLRTRQVFCHTEGIHLYAIDHLPGPESAAQSDKLKGADPV